MALTQDDRISISKKIVSVDIDNAIIDNTIAQLQTGLVSAQNKDASNINLIADIDFFIVPYQNEISIIEGKQRVILSNSHYLAAARGQTGNLFFPNDENTVVPSLGSEVWTQLTPFAGNGAIGKNKAESYASIAGEEPTASALQDEIDTYNALPVLDQPAYLPNVVTAANAYRTQLVNEQNTVWTGDPDATRDAQNDQAILDLQDAIDDIDDYLSSTTNVALAQLALDNRAPIRATRKSQINAILGSINQNLSTGEVTGGSGFYFDRFKFIVLRLDLLAGSLVEQVGIEKGISAQNSQKTFNSNAATTYLDVVYASKFIAPAANTGTVHVKDASGFSIGDSIYVVAENQQELVGNVTNIDNNTLFLDVKIPQRYTHENLARVYKVL